MLLKKMQQYWMSILKNKKIFMWNYYICKIFAMILIVLIVFTGCGQNRITEKEEKKEIAGLAKIGIDDFAKVEIRVGKVLDCENVKRSNKLLKFTIDDGSKEPRTIVSGIAKWYKPEELKGKNIVFVANLKPVKLCGVESNGMILSAECSEDDVKVLTVDKSIPAGSVIG